MDEVIHFEVLGRHGHVTSRYSISHLPIRVGRAYDNDVILEDPYVAPYHAVVERSSTGDLEVVDVGSKNGIFRVGSGERIVRENVDPAARYRAGHTEFRIRPASYPVPAERVERAPADRWRSLGTPLAVVAAATAALLSVWSRTYEHTSVAKMALPPLLLIVALFIWAGGWSLAGRVLTGRRSFVPHLQTAALAVCGFFIVGSWDYAAFAISFRELGYMTLPAAGALFAWALWRHLSIVTGAHSWRIAVAAVAVAGVFIGATALSQYADRVEDLTQMSYLKAVKAPALRLVKGHDSGEFFKSAARLKDELEPLKTK